MKQQLEARRVFGSFEAWDLWCMAGKYDAISGISAFAGDIHQGGWKNG